MKYSFIRDHRGAFSVSSLCRALEVGSSGDLPQLVVPLFKLVFPSSRAV
jgi:hypothetical protein